VFDYISIRLTAMIKAAIKHVSDMVTKRATAGSPSSSDDEEDERKDEIFDPVTPSKVSSSSSVGSGGIATKSPRSYIREFPYPYENLLSLNQIFFSYQYENFRMHTSFSFSVCIRKHRERGKHSQAFAREVQFRQGYCEPATLSLILCVLQQVKLR
jgi:hypothetical protein